LEAESQHSGIINAREHRHHGGSNPVDGEHHVARAEGVSQHGNSVTETKEEPLRESENVSVSFSLIWMDIAFL